MSNKKKRLVTNTDYEYYGSKNPICDASNNSISESCNYAFTRNCEWQMAYDYFYDENKIDYDVDII